MTTVKIGRYRAHFVLQVPPMSVKRLSDDKLIAVWNPVPVYNGRKMVVDGVWADGRNPLAIAVLDENGDILLAYCAGGKGDGMCLNRLRIRKISKAELVN